MALLVARSDSAKAASNERRDLQGWLIDTLKIPETSYHEIYPKEPKQEKLDSIMTHVLHQLLDESMPGIVKAIDLPSPNLRDERSHHNNINTRVLQRLFRSVFIHPIRGINQTSNVSSHSDDAKRAVGVPDCDTT